NNWWMKFISGIALVLFTALQVAHADIVGQGIGPTSAPPSAEPSAPSPSGGHRNLGLVLEAGYGFASVSPSHMNQALSDFQWTGGVVAGGSFSSMQYFDFAVGYKILPWANLMLRYEQ